MSENKMVRVEMEFEDGRIQRLSGEEAQKWLTAVNGQCTMGWVHGMPMPQFEWEVVKEGTKDEGKTG